MEDKMFLKTAYALFVLCIIVSAQDDFELLNKIVASDRATSDFFGSCVAIEGDYAVVGVKLKGACYIYKRNGTIWIQIKKIVSSDLASGDYFGGSVAISGEYVIVGAFGEDENASGTSFMSAAGSAYIFKQSYGGADNWGQIKKIVASDRAANDQFGYSVAISGNYAVVSAAYESEDASGANTISGAGSAYIFEKDQGGIDAWGQIKKIVSSDRAVDDNFGNSVVISDSLIVVGCAKEDEDESGSNTLSNAGSAYTKDYSEARQNR